MTFIVRIEKPFANGTTPDDIQMDFTVEALAQPPQEKK